MPEEGKEEQEVVEKRKRPDDREGGLQNNPFGDGWLEHVFCRKYVEATKELKADMKRRTDADLGSVHVISSTPSAPPSFEESRSEAITKKVHGATKDALLEAWEVVGMNQLTESTGHQVKQKRQCTNA